MRGSSRRTPGCGPRWRSRSRCCSSRRQKRRRRVMRRMQGTMSVVEGYSNLVMNELGAKLLPGFERLEEAYRMRSSGKSVLELLIWKLSGLDLKLQQYRRGAGRADDVF